MDALPEGPEHEDGDIWSSRSVQPCRLVSFNLKNGISCSSLHGANLHHVIPQNTSVPRSMLDIDLSSLEAETRCPVCLGEPQTAPPAT